MVFRRDLPSGLRSFVNTIEQYDQAGNIRSLHKEETSYDSEVGGKTVETNTQYQYAFPGRLYQTDTAVQSKETDPNGSITLETEVRESTENLSVYSNGAVQEQRIVKNTNFFGGPLVYESVEKVLKFYENYDFHLVYYHVLNF